jgi:SAM-dependent methyltransferase
LKSWWLDELTTAGAEHLDGAYVAGYDKKAQFNPSEDIELLQALGLDETSTVVDLGSGTGTFALAAAALGASVVAVDVAPAMVDALRSRTGKQGLPNLTVVEAGFLSYRHEGDPADVVFTRNALHQLPDFWKVIALRRIAQILRPGGLLRLRDLVFDIEPDQVEETVEAWMGSAVEDPAHGYTAPEFSEHVRSEFSTFTWLLDPMFPHAGFEVVDRDIRRSVYAAYTCRKVG